MKSYLITLIVFLLFLSSQSLNAEDNFPLRHPQPGESRPSWWWSAFYYDNIIVKGRIECEPSESPDVKVTFQAGVLERLVSEKHADTSRSLGTQYNVGTLHISEVLYVPSLLTRTDTIARKIKDKSLSSGCNRSSAPV